MADDQGNKKKRRGRGRAKGQVPAENPPEPTNEPVPSTSTASISSQAPPAGRGRGRGGAPAPANAPLTQQLGALHLGGQSSNSGVGDRGVGRGSIRNDRNPYIEAQLLHTRPDSVKNTKKGVSGRTAIFQANFFKVTKRPNWSLNRYHVDFNPVEDRTKMRKIFMREHKGKLGMYLFDGSTLFSINNICPNNKAVDFFSKRLSDEEKIRISIKPAGTVEVSDDQNRQVMNIILRECMSKMNLHLIKRNYYDKEARVSIREHNLELWPGYITAMGQYEYDVLLQTEIIYKTLRQDTAYNVLNELIQRNAGSDWKPLFSSTIIGTTVMTTYNDKTYRITDVSYKDNPESTFVQKTKDGEKKISYRQYYEQRYGVKIRDARQPLLLSKTSARDRRANKDCPDFLCLVPELCVMTGLSDNMRGDYRLMRAVAEHTAVNPSDRVHRLEAFRKRLMDIPEVKAKLEAWGLGLGEKLVEVRGRILPSEEIYIGQNKKLTVGENADWTQHLKKNPLLSPATLKQWVVIFPSQIAAEARNLARMIEECGRGLSFHVPAAQPHQISNDSTSAYVQAIEDAVNKYNPQLLVFLVPNNRSDRYSAIKKKTIIDKSIPSQVVLLKNVRANSAMSIATKITIQINCKIGGAPWGVQNPIKSGMVVGFDVCHDPRDKRKSFGAMVSSLDQNFGSYYSTVNSHASGDELCSSFTVNMRKAVTRFQARNGKLPSPIIVYRDGVGDGDLANVYEIEVKDMLAGLEPIYKDKGTALKLAVIVVTKRINTRIFYDRRNPPPGTIVDDVITNPNRFDFFLVSQSVRQGTVTPTHYNVIHDTTGWQPEHFQRFTYKMTYMYFNWSGTIRVPAPCQYAHKLALLTSQNVGVAHDNLSELLYFL